MIPRDFYEFLVSKNITFFAGVPDSLLKDFCAYVTDHTSIRKNIIAANEGNAIALATGYHLATGKIPLVYMQNSGQGNAINPLTSLADSEVYSIPILLLIGWRGEPGKKDEPQHIKQGRITLKLLETLEIPYAVVPKQIEEAKLIINKAIYYMNTKSAPYALVVEEGNFDKYVLQNEIKTKLELEREDAIKEIINFLDVRDVVVSTTGKISRELFEYREEKKQGHSQDFLTVGSMGHASQIALGIALEKPNSQIFCLDGDGAVIMHMGALAVIGHQEPTNFKHIVLNNGAHDSVGGQPTAGFWIDLRAIAKACGYKNAFQAQTRGELASALNLLRLAEGPALLEIKLNKGARKNLGRPTTTPLQNKFEFMKFLK